MENASSSIRKALVTYFSLIFILELPFREDEAFRLVNGEGDSLSGLIANPLFALQLTIESNQKLNTMPQCNQILRVVCPG